MTQNIKGTLSHVLAYCFIVFKYVILILRIENTFYGELANIFGDLGRSWINFRDLRSKTKYFQGAEDFFSWILGDKCIILREQGSTDSPWGPQEHINPYKPSVFL